jgi:hypothetical protein
VAFSLYADEDTTHNAVFRALRAELVDCLTTVEANREGASDESQLEFASASGRTILTTNQGDFVKLYTEWARAGRNHGGIIILTDQRISPGLLIAKLFKLQHARSYEQMVNAILFVGPTQIA